MQHPQHDTSVQVPFLPGYTFGRQKKSYARSQSLSVRNGVMCTDGTASAHKTVRQLGSTRTLLTSSRKFADQMDADDVPFKASQNKKKDIGLTSRRPAWIEHSGHVLRFRAFFKEPVHSSPLENFRVRKFTILFFLEDDTVKIVEPAIQNSGLTQGVFLKRSKAHLDDEDHTELTLDHLDIGNEIPLSGHVFRITSTDSVTQQYFDEIGRENKEPEEIPDDPFHQSISNKNSSFNKKRNPLKTFMEASAGRANGVINVAATQKFLQNDGLVLRFFCTWDDPSLYGERRPYVLRYFLADDTVEVSEIPQPNSGRESFSALLKRCKLPKNYSRTVANVATIGAGSQDKTSHYTEEDLRIGATVNVFGRELLLCACDEFTKQYYLENFEVSEGDFEPIDMGQPVKELPRMATPPYNGFGTDEDSLGSFLHLVPKVPRKNFTKLSKYDGKSMRFLGKLANPSVEDVDRTFVITYFRADDTVSIFERVERNSGFVGGKFLERCRARNQGNGRYLEPEEFFVGATVRINGFDFNLFEADEYTFVHMEDEAERFDVANPERIVEKVKRASDEEHDVKQQLAQAFSSIDTDGSGRIDKSEFKAMLQQTQPDINDHEAITLMRKFDTNNDGHVDFAEFLRALEE